MLQGRSVLAAPAPKRANCYGSRVSYEIALLLEIPVLDPQLLCIPCGTGSCYCGTPVIKKLPSREAFDRCLSIQYSTPVSLSTFRDPTMPSDFSEKPLANSSGVHIWTSRYSPLPWTKYSMHLTIWMNFLTRSIPKGSDLMTWCSQLITGTTYPQSTTHQAPQVIPRA